MRQIWLIKKKQLIENIIPKKLTFDALVNWNENIIYQPAVFWRSELWHDVGGLNPKLDSAMDYDLWLKFSKIGEGNIINRKLAVALRHEKAKTCEFTYINYTERAFVLALHGELEKGKELIVPAIRRVMEINDKFAWVINSSCYRKVRKIIFKD